MLCATLASGFEPQRCARRAATTRRAATSDAQLLDAACEAARAAGALIRGASSAGRAVAQSKANARTCSRRRTSRARPPPRCSRRASPRAGSSARRTSRPAATPRGARRRRPSRATASSGRWTPSTAPRTSSTRFRCPPVSVAAVKCRSGAAPEVVAGAVYDPSRDELFGALRGAGAWCQRGGGARAPLAASPNALRDAVVYAGAPPTRALDPSLRGIAAVAPKARTMRLLGSAAIMLAYGGAAPQVAAAGPRRCADSRDRELKRKSSAKYARRRSLSQNARGRSLPPTSAETKREAALRKGAKRSDGDDDDAAAAATQKSLCYAIALFVLLVLQSN
ncbi:inositol-1-monophosphatase [Aureococcus anophagefferens]|nr:inositol-1-monophosphatase [Aureococcus anophagefferens]